MIDSNYFLSKIGVIASICFYSSYRFEESCFDLISSSANYEPHGSNYPDGTRSIHGRFTVPEE
jgi:hypothetical protein